MLPPGLKQFAGGQNDVGCLEKLRLGLDTTRVWAWGFKLIQGQYINQISTFNFADGP